MSKLKLYNKIEEAIASKKTSAPNRALLTEIKKELQKAKNKEETIVLIIKLIEIFGILGSNFL